MKRLLLFLLLTSCLFCFKASGNTRSKLNKLEPIQITSLQQENLMALSRLYSYARYFYPNPNLKELDWLRFLMHAIPQTIGATNNIELEKAFKLLFVPIVPQLTFSKSPEEVTTEKPISITAEKEMYIRENLSPSISCLYFTVGEIKQISYRQGLPYPDKIYSYKLGEELYANYPIALTKLPEGESKTLKHLIKLANKTHWHHGSCYRDPIFRIANAIMTFSYINHFYPYFEEDSLSSSWDIASAAYLKQVASSTRYTDYLLSSNELMAHLHDSHIFVAGSFLINRYIASYQPYYLPSNFTTTFIENRMFVTWSGVDSLKRGDEIVAVNGVPMNQFIERKMKYIPASTPTSALLRLNNEEAFKTFSKDSTIILSAQSLNGKLKKITISPNSLYGAGPDWNAKFITNLGDSIYKINPCIDAANYQEFKNNFSTFKQAKGLIVDMRGYPRSCIYSILSNLIDSTLHVGKIETPICYFPYQRNRELILRNDSDNWVIYPGTKPQNGRWLSALSNEETQQLVKERLNIPIIFITNAECMSQGETIMEMVKRQKLGLVLGEPTCGTNGNAVMYYLKAMGFLMTSQHFANGDGTRHHGIGVLPDVPCSQTIDDFKNHKDTMIEKAKKIIIAIKK